MTSVKSVTGALALLFALYNVPAIAKEVPLVATYEQPQVEVVEITQNEVVFQSGEIVQELPNYSAVWLDGRVSFVGGEITTSERQFAFAQANAIPLMSSDAEYWRSIRDGHFVPLRHPALVIGARRPYVLPTTARFIYGIAEQFSTAGCGRLRINDAARLVPERPRNGSPHSVHPAGMALDLRVIDLSEHCYAELNRLLHTAEAERQADVTREHSPPHFHVVVIPRDEIHLAQLSAQYESTDGQSE